MKVIAIIAARMGSKRMYGKPLKRLEGKSIIEHVIDRLKTAELIDEIIIATSPKKENKVFIELAKKIGVKHFVGDEEDVLDRYVQCTKKFKTGHVVRATSENPLIYVEHLDELIKKHVESGSDFTHMEDLPLGCDIEIISANALYTSHRLGQKKHHSELVSLFIFENRQMFKITKIAPKKELQKPMYRLTVDTEKDLELMRKIYSELYKEGEIIKLGDVVRLLDENPELLKINLDIPVGTSRVW